MNQAVTVGNNAKTLVGRVGKQFLAEGQVYKKRGITKMISYIKDPGGSKMISNPGTGIRDFQTQDLVEDIQLIRGGGWRKEPGGLRK